MFKGSRFEVEILLVHSPYPSYKLKNNQKVSSIYIGYNFSSPLVRPTSGPCVTQVAIVIVIFSKAFQHYELLLSPQISCSMSYLLRVQLKYGRFRVLTVTSHFLPLALALIESNQQTNARMPKHTHTHTHINQSAAHTYVHILEASSWQLLQEVTEVSHKPTTDTCPYHQSKYK